MIFFVSFSAPPLPSIPPSPSFPPHPSFTPSPPFHHLSTVFVGCLYQSRMFGRRDVWAPGRLGAGACASEILGIGHSSNVYVITATHYFHQSNFCSKQDHFHSEKICLLRSFCIDPASISVKNELFSSKQLRSNSLLPIQG